MKMTKLLSGMLALAAIPAFAAASDATPKRVGPVSYYGALHTDGSKIIGAKNNKEAMLRGMSLFWSDATGQPYYNKTVIGWAAENLPMDVFRFAMGITYYDSDGGTSNKLDADYSYASTPEGYKALVDKMVEAAIENDIYIILDWHSHRADSEQAIAKKFFEEMSAKYKDVPNVIYEIFNEPVHQGWSQVTTYANAVIPGIRANTQNLVLVGTPSWSQMTSYGGVSGTNVGYVLHFYAGTHSKGEYGGRATAAKAAGNAVFITEWGTVNADGAGSASTGSTNEWTAFMDENNISNCNWSLRAVGSPYAKNGKTETSAIFEGDDNVNTIAALNKASYSSSGELVKAYLGKHVRSWGDSLVAGKNTGSCAFKSTSVKETESQITGVLKSGCTYESSNASAIAVDGSNMIVKGVGYSILTGSDGSQSFVQVTSVPKQTILNFQDVTCSYNGECSITGARALLFSGGTNKEYLITSDTKTQQGATFTITSLNPEIVTVKKAKCTNSSCFGEKDKQVTMFEFKGYGTAKVVATAPAVTGFAALNDTISVTFKKGVDKMTNKFKDTKVDLGATLSGYLPAETMGHTKVTYTFNGKETSPYVTQNGTDLVAGNENAVIIVTANAPEAEKYVEMHQSITVIVGDSSKAVNKEEYQNAPIIQTRPELPLQAVVAGNMLSVNSNQPGEIEVEVFSVTGQNVLNKTLSKNYGALSLANIPNGAYLITIRQGTRQLNVKWNKK